MGKQGKNMRRGQELDLYKKAPQIVSYIHLQIRFLSYVLKKYIADIKTRKKYLPLIPLSNKGYFIMNIMTNIHFHEKQRIFYRYTSTFVALNVD